jgi:hypothetical protein
MIVGAEPLVVDVDGRPIVPCGRQTKEHTVTHVAKGTRFDSAEHRRDFQTGLRDKNSSLPRL